MYEELKDKIDNLRERISTFKEHL